jgi:hypothetical protein
MQQLTDSRIVRLDEGGQNIRNTARSTPLIVGQYTDLAPQLG